MTKLKNRCHKLFRPLYPASGLAVALVSSLPFNPAFALSSSWSQKPSWAAEESSAAHRITKDLERTRDISPFSPGSHNIALDLGQVFLMGDLTKYADSIGSQVHYTYGVSDLFSFDTSLGYSDHSDGKFSMTSLLAGMRLNMSWYDKVIPHAVFGLGFYRPSYQDSTQPQANSQIGGSTLPSTTPPSVSAFLFGIHFGPGIDLQVSRNIFFGTALMFHNMFGSTRVLANGTPLNVGGLYTSFYLQTGVTF
ncbi:MAG: hypothetical protein ACO3A2_06860 [Bdellovibrionia bacterium]